MLPYPADNHSPSTTEFVVTMERPSSEQLSRLNRAQKLALLRERMDERRAQLLEWIERRGLSGEITIVGEPTAFSLLFVRCTPDVARQLIEAPGVENVAMASSHELRLL